MCEEHKAEWARSEEDMRTAVIERERALNRCKEMEDHIRAAEKEVSSMREMLDASGLYCAAIDLLHLCKGDCAGRFVWVAHAGMHGLRMQVCTGCICRRVRAAQGCVYGSRRQTCMDHIK